MSATTKPALTVGAEGYSLVAIEIADDAAPYFDFDYPDRVCFVLGNEARGIYNSVLAKCDAAVFIPMAGKGRSLNVHVAGAIVAFHGQSVRLRSA